MTLDELASALADPTWHVWMAGEPEPLALICIDPSERWVRALATREDARRRGLGATAPVGGARRLVGRPAREARSA